MRIRRAGVLEWGKLPADEDRELDAQCHATDDGAGHQNGFEKPGCRGDRGAGDAIDKALHQRQARDQHDDAGGDQVGRRERPADIAGEGIKACCGHRRDESADHVLVKGGQAEFR